MSGYVLSRVRMGERSGYRAAWCDAPHWGIVTSGSLAIEWEDDVEVLAAGDVFHCPAGPPGHRAEAADPATFLDLTPLSAFEGGGRLSDWRRGAEGVLRDTEARDRGHRPRLTVTSRAREPDLPTSRESGSESP